MLKFMTTSLGIIILAVILIGSGALYVVDETQQVVITQFGEPIGEPVTQAGLYFKLPVVQIANYFDKRILRWDGDPNQIPTGDKRYIWVDTTARWRIVDPLKFMQTVSTETGAYARLDDIVDADVRDAISALKLVETVRNSNRLYETQKETNLEYLDEQIETGVIEKISVGREEITKDILNRAKNILPQYGIELVDVRIKRINYIRDVQNKVYDRMISERKRAAEQFRSEGQGKKAEIEGQTAKELQEITSMAYRKAQEIKGDGDAQATKIYAEAYNKDPEFYSFLKTLETYRKTINSDTHLILTTDSDYYEYIKGIQGGGQLP